MDAILEELQGHLLQAQHSMKRTADLKRRDVSFDVGDLVFLKIRPYRHRSLAKFSNEKFSPRFYGPYRVVARIGAVAYQLQLPTAAKIHPVFHVSQLKKAIGVPIPAQEVPPVLAPDLELRVEPERLLATHFSKVTGQLEVLLQWRYLPDFESSWELFDVIQQQFPEFHLEDKVTLLGGRVVDKPLIRQVYVRNCGGSG
ncbi:uncharacterized protein LOC112092588 [Morus notabilis]|uniref:uncharacterized protein LOC112092588 n=1 Tax=Morus notabilis TaxID=981085 RepID=UPI000CECF382|nr:uncharacterized protein LOC112092588 [Morus notabilis]